MKKGGLFKTIRVFVVLIVAIVIAASLVIMRPKAQRQVVVQKGRLVEVFPAKAENIQMVVESFGTVEPRESLKLVAQVHGQIVDTFPEFEEGSFVKKGTRLIQIDPRTYELEARRRKVQITQTEAELKRLNQEVVNLRTRIKIARSDVTLAKNEYLRLKKLIDRKVIAQSQLDKAEQSYLASLERRQSLENQLALIGPQKEQLMASRDMAEVMYQQAELDLERSSIETPFDGWVLQKIIEVGQHVNVGQQLGSIYKAGELDIEVNIPTREFKWLPGNIGEKSSVAADVIFRNTGDQQVWKGRVTRVKASMDQKTRTLPVVIEVDETASAKELNGGFRLRPGMFVTARIKGKAVDRAYVLPRHVVYPGDVVYTLEGDQLKIKAVTVLRSYKESVIVTEGIADGDRIIRTPLTGAVDGMNVRIKE